MQIGRTMKILVINGSPKGAKSSTIRMADAFLSGMKETILQDIEAETIQVNACKINPCTGCFGCWTETPGRCVQHDDMDQILPKIEEADLIIWSLPLYYFGMPSKVKALMDRTLPDFMPWIRECEDGGYTHPKRYPDKLQRTILISTGGLGAIEHNFEALEKQFEIIYGEHLTRIFCPQGGAFPHDNIDSYLSSVKTAGNEYGSFGKITKETIEKLDKWLYEPGVYVELANESWDIKDGDKQISDQARKNNAAERFTKQMAALYHPDSFDGETRVLEMNYTDVGETYQLILGQHTCEVRHSDFIPYTTKIETPLTVWQDISKGVYSGEQAMMDGKYRTTGDLKLLISWNRYFGNQTATSTEATSHTKKTEKISNMTIMIIPWTIIWVLLSINPVIGGIAGLLSVAAIHYANLKWQLTIYDHLTGTFVSLFSLAALLGQPMALVIPLSYLCFGLLWLGSCFSQIPLSAHYSKNGYNGDDALKNPLFMKTNWILSFSWALLYLITPIWTYFIVISDFTYLTGIVNTICPILLGVFTNWFQKWYPARVASQRY